MTIKTIKNGWTRRRKKQQAARCRYKKPWKSSTGPKTQSGKNSVKTNALKHAMRSHDAIILRKLLFAQRSFLNAITDEIKKDKK